MKQIIIKSMALTNFKGIKSLDLTFEELTDIFGANGTGKTTIFDAFTWALFGKDSSERKDFEIKTLDKFGKVIPEIEHEVSVQLLVDNEPISIRRILKESWVKKRGSELPEFKGNVSEFYWNDVPVNLTEFNKHVSEVLDENVFKIITSPTYFNSIKWPERRNVLTQIAGEVSDAELASGNSEYEKLVSKLTQGKTIEEYKLQIAASIKKSKEDLKAIPTRIDEVFKSRPEDVNFAELEKLLQEKGIEFNNVEESINNVTKSIDSQLQNINAYKTKVSNLKYEISQIEANAKAEASERLKPDTSKVDALQRELSSKKQELSTYQSSLQTLATKHTSLVQQRNELEEKILAKRTEWNTENAKQISFNDSDFHCPTCKREFESGDAESKKVELTDSFNKSKQTRLSEISARGKSLSAEKENTETEITNISERIKNGKTVVDNLEKEITTILASISQAETPTTENSEVTPELLYESILSLNADYKSKKEELKTLEANPVQDVTIDNSELVEKKKAIQSEIDNLKSELSKKAQIEAADKRIKELKEEEKTLSQFILGVEREQFVIENFIKDKIDRLESAINAKFQFIRFKMFEEQINGGLKETCEAMVDGVPYSDLNTASKINAGLDVINTLSGFYGVCAPIFVDNAESVHTLIDTKSQLIRLVVSEEAKKLTVFHSELVA